MNQDKDQARVCGGMASRS